MTQYLAYALGEIFLVVIGILIALQVNTWNDDRKQKVMEEEFIEGIKNDLKQDKAYIQNIIQLAEEKEAAYSIIEKDLMSLYQKDRHSLDSLLSFYFVSQRTFYPIFGSFQSAVSGNEITKFRNKKFSAEVTKLYQSTYARLSDNAKDTDDRWVFVIKKYSEFRRTNHLRDMSDEELTEFLNESYYHMSAIIHYVGNLKATMVDIDEILQNY